jgi:hypothetical protein
VKKFMVILTGAMAAMFFWRRRTQPSKNQQAVKRAKARLASGLAYSRSAVDRVRQRFEERGDESRETPDDDAA